MKSSNKLGSVFSNLPVSRKILAIAAVSSLATLAILCTLFFLKGREMLIEKEVDRLDTLIRVLEHHPVIFESANGEAAQQALESFKFSGEKITSAHLYDRNGVPLASYWLSPESTAPPFPQFIGKQWRNGHLLFSTPIDSNGEPMGSVLVVINANPLRASIKRLLALSLLILVGGLALTLAIAWRMQKSITGPINALVEVTHNIATEKDFSAKAVKVNDDEIGTLAQNVNDVLETLRLRDESLRRVNASLEETVEKRTKDLNLRNNALKEAINAAEAAAKAKSDFLATTSHELRTPLNPIIGYVERLLEKSNDAESKRELETIKQSAELLLRLIDDILDFTRVERGDIRIRDDEIDFQQCCQDVMYLMQEEAAKKGLNIELNLDFPEGYTSDKAVVIESDEGRLKQVTFNLIGNAIKFTDKGTIRINSRIERIEKNFGKLHVSVKDTGIGISKEDIKKLFKPFSQIDTGPSRKYRGMGLGLAISRSFVEAMGGTISCTSVEGEGSEFSFEIPIVIKGQRENDEPVTPNPHEAPPPHSSRSLLLVDDERVNRELGASMIRSLGYNVVCAKDGFEALDLCREQVFDLILMDIRMPRLDGFSTAEALRKRQNESASVPIIALSAHITQQDERRCQDVGMNDSIQKPLNIQVLREVLHKWLDA